MRRLRSLLAITSVRLSLAYTLIFGVVAVIIVLYMTWTTTNILHRKIAESINVEVTELADIYDDFGMNGLMHRLERSAAAPGANLYVVSDPAGQIVAGNVRDLDTGVIDRLGWTGRPFSYTPLGDEDRGRHRAIARILLLPNSMRLLVGRDLGEPERFNDVIGQVLILSLGAMVVLGLATWVLIGRRALRRLERVSQSTSRIMAGDRSERLPVYGTNDEFDRLSQRLNMMLDRINQLDDGLRHVSDNIAHDLKTPLTRLRNKADTAAGRLRKPAELRSALEQIIADTDQIIRTFDALLMIARVESGSNPVRLECLDLSAIAADVAELYQPLVEDSGVGFSQRIEAGVTIRGNRELLSQALANLVDNALKYGRPESGDAQIAIRLSVREGSARICIADRGPGIDAADRERATERFVRLEASRSQPGNGLGLSLVSAVAQLHGGVLELADNEPGLVACLVLPLDTAQPAG